MYFISLTLNILRVLLSVVIRFILKRLLVKELI